MATNPLFTAAFDLASGDDYGAFLAGIRDRLGSPRHVSHGRPVLPPVEPGVPPRRWFHVLLRTPASALTLATRADNLRLAGFQSADGTWWELSHGTFPRRRGGLIPGATSLGFAGTYRDLVGGTREVANVALGRRQMTEAVDALAAFASGGATDAKQSRRRLAKDALVVLLLMVHEATRFLDVAAVVAGLMRPDAAATSGRITTRSSTSPDLGWRYWSCLLLSADSHPSMPTGIGEPRPTEHLNKEWVERAAATVGILLFVKVGNGIKAEKALRLFRGNLCGTGRDGAGPDVTFLLVSGESVAAHRYVLAGKSPVFLRQFIGRRIEKPSPHVEVKDMDAASFKAMIYFIYTDTVPEFDQRRTPEEEEEAVAVMAHHLLAAAHRYELDRLKLICKRKLQSGATYVDMAARTLALAEQHNYRRLKAKCIDFIVGSPETLHAVLATEGYKHLEASCPAVLTELLKSVHGRKNLISK
ncbi:hypothetical protein SETIT_8G149100v2 [Setaria italica]|uniref:rRNA N-glycosidase n=2 Tax=Setaria italica TaxID=4555 RepID=A0A368S7X0_SETIT|nr:protein synthesis inhibitor II [Setaria italica]RCV38516.1 hypothetical protein SETIT_8G149100v2 [Setaria italica]